jgi:hypothetical protein
MAGRKFDSVEAPLTANGTSSGEVSVADASLFTVGAVVVLGGQTAPRAAYRVVSVDPDANRLTLEPALPGDPTEEQILAAVPTVANYTTADGARVSQAEQFVYTPQESEDAP